MDKYDALKLSSQLCFPLYATANEVIKLYKPFLDPLDLTYTQYIVMLALWEKDEISVKELGTLLHLDSGTLTPLLKKLESKGFVEKKRCSFDERSVIVCVTDKGKELKDKAVDVPYKIAPCVRLTPEEAKTLYVLTHKLLDSFEK